MPAARRRIPTWLLIVACVALCLTMVRLESADLFPFYRFAVQWTPDALPSSRAVPPAEVTSGVPVLSLTLEDEVLHDPANGILTRQNIMKHGEEWEREGSVSYFDGGRMLFASGVGVRVHGGSSRHRSPRNGFRLYFRREYGPRELPRGVIFSPAADPVRRLVIHDDMRQDSDGTMWYFVNPLAYDIAMAMGAIAPETKPVRFFLNGEYWGPFVLTERFDERFFAAHFGYDDVLLSREEMDKLFEWVRETQPLTMQNVSEHVNLENLTRWFLAVAFCATRDAYQGPGQFLDQTKRSGGWFWVNWDMDQSFRDWNHDSFQYLLERIGEQRRGRNPSEPRAVILSELIANDAGYREYLKREVQRVLNHHVTDAFLQERYNRYLDIAGQLRVSNLDYLPRLRRFLENRRAFFRMISEQWLNTGPSQQVRLSASPGVSLLIDGERVSGGYEGLYFPDLEMVVDLADSRRSGLTGWRVNGRIVAGAAPLRFKADRPLVIEPVFDITASAFAANAATADKPAASASAPSGATADKPSASSKLVWRTIPAGASWMGCVPNDTRCNDEERPRVQTTIAAPFQMLDREVSAGDFRAFTQATSRKMPRQPEWYADDTHPVVNVTWDEAREFCAWAGGRLPTEAEWEHAARGGLDARLFPWGDEFTGGVAARHNVGRRKYEYTAPTGSFAPNGFGLYDMAGNVWEWTASEHRRTHASTAAEGVDFRTIKGGGWDNNPRRLRVSERNALSRYGRHNLYVGFRCIRSPQK
jgi:formylglycine-generating enzyme required for sulfatase activity